MDKADIGKVKCFVVFTRSKVKHWVFRFIDPEIQHVYVMIKSDGGQFWTIINPLCSHTHIETVLVDDYPHPRCYTGDYAVIVPIVADIDLSQRRWSICVFSCVEVVKSLLGIKSFRTLTPYQLYRLIKGI